MNDDTTMRNASGLFDDLSSPQLYIWEGQAQWGSEPPVGGDTASIGRFDMSAVDSIDDVDSTMTCYVEVPASWWGDYVGDVVNRANHKVLWEDHEDHLVQVSDALGAETLMVPLNASIPVELYESICGLSDYPILDESVMYELEAEIEEENWDSWGRSEFMRIVESAAAKAGEEYDFEDHDLADELRDEVANECDYLHWQSEGATSGYWTDMDLAAERAWALIVEWRSVPVPA